MPRYDYSCTKCDFEFEVSHSMMEKPDIHCPDCDSLAKKMVSLCGIIVHETAVISHACDCIKSEGEARSDLRENYGVENVSPTSGSSFSDVYKDVKSRGSFVKDRMAQEKEVKGAQREAKSREWKKKANKRVAKRTHFANEMKAKESAAKRAIRLSS